MQFWAGLGRNHLFHVLKTAKHLFWKQGCPKKGHASAPQWHRLHPLKTAKHLFWKQGCPKKGQSFFAKKSITFDKFIEIIVKL